MIKQETIEYEDYTDSQMTVGQVVERMEELQFKLLKENQRVENAKTLSEQKEHSLKAAALLLEYQSLGIYSETLE